MKNPITKFTAAAIVFIVVIVGINVIPGSNGPIALAGVIETFKNATCISYDMQLGDNAPFIHDTVYRNIIRRESMGSTAIIDLDKQEILSLTPSSKQAVMINFDGLSEKPFNYINRLVNILTELQQEKGFETNRLEPREIDGKQCIGYMATDKNIDVEIWINLKDSLPVQIIEKRPSLEVTLKNFDFDVEPDPVLFSTALPDGYTFIDTRGQINFTKDATEENFIKLLEMLATLHDGWFPQDVSIEWFVNNSRHIGTLIEQNYEGTVRQMQTGLTMGKGLAFLRFFQGEGQWHYVGNGVKMGQNEVPVFWYQPKDSNAYRVIFGDLHVEDVAADKIAALTEKQQAAAGFGYQIWDQSGIVGQQEDTWYVKAGQMVEVHSVIDIRMGPADLSEIALELPYENARLISAKFGTAAIEYDSSRRSYRFFPESGQLASGEHVLSLIWEFSLENLDVAEYGYVVPLESFVPVTSYKITAVLEPDCGFDWALSEGALEKVHKLFPSDNGENSRMMTLFTGSQPNPKKIFGTCGLSLKPE